MPSAMAEPCPDTEVVFARGTAEPPGVGGLGQAFIDSLRAQTPRSVSIYAVNYPATEDFANSLAAGVDDASAHVQSTAANCPDTKMVLGGYSQGAAVVDATTEALPPAVADHVAAVALFGNPKTAYAASKMPGRPLPAISPRYSSKTVDMCVQDDPICSEGHNPFAHGIYGWTGMPMQAATFAANRL